MKKSIYLWLLFISTSLSAQDLWDKHFSVMGLGSVSNVEHADLDDDGLEDIIVGTNIHLSWIKNMGNGHFAHQPMISTLQGSNFYCEDIDMDGDTDVILNNDFFLNDSNGNFTLLEVEFDTWQRIRGFMDYNGDGHKDLITIESTSEVINLYLNNGQLEYEFAQTLATGYTDGMVNDFNIVDIDQDADLDFLLSTENGLTILKNSNGNFGELNISNAAIGLSNHGDINGDGHLDIVLQNKTTEEVQLYLNDGNGDWDFESVIYAYSSFIKNIDVIDIDADNDLDIVFTRSNTRIAWFENMSGDFSTVHHISSLTSGVAKMVDLDNDGALDILTSKGGTLSTSTLPKISWFKNEDNSFVEKREIAFHFNESPSSWPSFTAADIDNDGDQDLIVNERGIRLAENYGGDIVGIPRVLVDIATFKDIILKDTDQNDYLDILGIQGDTLVWCLNDGNGNFSNIVPIGTKQFYFRSAANAADLDNDGDLDVISHSYETETEDSEIFWFENIDGTNYTKHILFDDVIRVNKIEISDLNGNSNIDIIVATSNSDDVLVFENQGNGNFSNYYQEIIGFPINFHVIDMDNDDLEDMVYSYTNSGGGAIRYTKNLGNGNWAASSVVSSFFHGNESPVVFDPKDMNGDGLVDIVYAVDRIKLSQFDYRSEAGVVLNQGNSNFADPTRFFEYDYYRHEYNYIIAADMDGDNAPDPVVHYAARDLNVNYADDEFNDIAWFKSTFDVIPSITTSSFNVNCNSNQTLDDTDDYLDLDLNVAGVLTSDNYEISLTGGTISPEMGAYNQTQQFTIVPDNSNTDSLYLKIIDEDNDTLMIELAIEDSRTCSDYSSFVAINASNINCLPGDELLSSADDMIVFDLNINSSSLMGDYTLTGDNFNTTNGSYNELLTFTAEPGTAGNGDLILMLNDTNDPNQTIEITIEDPGTCSDYSSFIAINISNVVCLPGELLMSTVDDMIAFDLDINSDSLIGTYTLAGDNFTTANGNYNTLQTFTAEPGTAGSGELVLTLNDTDHPDQTIEITVEDPGTCNVVSIAELSNDIEVLATPNPFNHQLSFEITNAINIQDFILQIVSVTGEEINHHNLSSEKLSLDMSQFAAGLYIYQLIDKKNGAIKASGVITKQ